MSGTWRTVDGEILDGICHCLLSSKQHLPAVLAPNLGLATLGPVYPPAALIEPPDGGRPVTSRSDRTLGRDMMLVLHTLVDGADLSAVLGDRPG